MAKTVFGKDGLIPGEITWKNWEQLTVPKFCDKVGNMLNFYNKNCEKSDLKADLLEWMKYRGYTKKEVSKIRSRYDEIPFTAAKIARAVNIGMPEEHPEHPNHHKSMIGFIEQHISTVLSSETIQTQSENQDESKAVEPKKSPAQRLQDKVETTVLWDLSSMMDEWILSGDNKIEPINIVNSIKNHDIPPRGYKFVREWISRWNQELESARDETDKDFVEGYSYLNKRAKNAWIKHLSKMLSDIDSLENKEKKNRKARKTSKSTQKKQTAAQIAKKVSNVKYQESADIASDLILNSIQPIEILGRLVLYTYNTKYKRFSCYTAKNRDGLTVTGTTVKEFDPDSSYSVTLRKPEQILRLFLNVSTKQSQIENEIQKVNGKRSVPNGRINQNTVLLTSFRNKES